MPDLNTLADITRFHAANNPDKVALVAGDVELTYAQLDELSNRVANALAVAGVGNQDRVGYVAKNLIEYFAFTFGAAKLNAVTVAVNWRLAPPEIEYILDNAEAKVVLFENEFLGHLAKMNLAADPLIVAVGGDGQHVEFDQWIADATTTDPMVAATIDDTAVQLYTSGTTGLPKGAELSNRNLFSIVGPLSSKMGLNSDKVLMHMLPLFHIGGSGVAIIGLYNGMKNVIHRDVDPGAIFRDIPAHGVTHAFMVPALLQVLPTIPGASDVDYSSLEQILYGASPITEEVLIASMGLLKCDHCQAYGLTETTGAITLLMPEDHDPGGPRAHLLRSAGGPVDGVELRIVDEEGNDLPDGEIGEVWCRTVQNLKGYWRNPEATEAVYPEGRDETGFGWFATGDAGYLEDGFLFIRDRVKDMIVSGGENVYPAEIENVLMSHPEIADCAVIGVPSQRWGETVMAIITPVPGTDPSQDDIIAYCTERLAKFKCPTSVTRMETIPRNPSGKVLKTEL
ncbi:MAG: long-chain-fatty-acid--CoA ligase, partial [Acidimicrobiales bacterium]|nr:long-chain-fatty-acid--CoA ligase [Acidimicrobiales bacterium]